MTNAPQFQQTGCSHAILSKTKISQVYRTLAGKEPRRTGSHKWRAVATWRNGDGFNVSLDDARGVWHDFTTDEGGGVLDLIVRITGGSRQDALRRLADLVGSPLDNRSLSAAERMRWARQRRRVELQLPSARLWRRAAIALCNLVLDSLKAGLANPEIPWPDGAEIARWTAQLAEWHRLDGPSLVDEFLWWSEHEPDLTAAMVLALRSRETAERRALVAFLSWDKLRTTDDA